MEICLVGYIDRTPENERMFGTYEFRNDFWAEKIMFRRKDRRPLADGELKCVSEWIDREIVKKHRVNWLSEKHPAYADIADAEVLKKYWPWMSDKEIKQRLDKENHIRAIASGFSPGDFKRLYLSEPAAYTNKSKQLELNFK